ncbi:MAG: hypothetical protein ACKVJU_14550 [Verrucomicrobiales bacterium]
MKTTFALFSSAFLFALSLTTAGGQGFTDSDIIFYGEVRQVGGAGTVLLQSGLLEVTFVNEDDPSNRVTLKTNLRPTGSGVVKPFSYSLKVPLAYLPEAPRIGEFLSIGTESTNFKIEGITIDGAAATLPDGSEEFYGFSFASRASENRLDLIVGGDSTDADNDGLPDWWEELYGLDISLNDAGGDLDDDGWSNLEEFRQGSNPDESNRDPQMVTKEVLVPETGVAGMYLRFLDSDSATDEILITVVAPTSAGFEIFDGETLLSPEQSHEFPLADLLAGRLTIRHIDRAVAELDLQVSWNDGGVPFSGPVKIRANLPSTEDGSDATLWLDGVDLVGETAVDVWSDRSGNGRDAMQPLADHQPQAVDGAVDFSQSRSAHLFFQDDAVAIGDHTLLTAYRAPDSSDANQTLLATNRGHLEIAPTTRAVSYPGAPTYQMDAKAVRGYESTVGNTASTSIFRREGNRLENVHGLSYDGESVDTTAIAPVLATLGGRRLAMSSSQNPIDNAFTGQLQEILVFPSALPEQKLRDVHDYLCSKWDEAVIWDLSTELRTISISADSVALLPHIMRGGHGDDQLGGGPEADTISGGPGSDVLTGGDGADRFVFGGLDTGTDRITDFDPAVDVVDLSALFWGQTGDAREFISVRLDTNNSTPVPTIDSVLIVERSDGETQEIVLQNTVVGDSELIQFIVEGRIRMGGLSVPTNVELTLVSEYEGEVINEPFDVVLTRSGPATVASLDVPLGFFDSARSSEFEVEGASSNDGLRSVVSFARGETSKTLTVKPLSNTAPLKSLDVAALPNFRYNVAGDPIRLALTDLTDVWLEVIQPNAIAEEQPARVRVYRYGDLSESLSVDLRLGGTAREGRQIETVPRVVTIGANSSFAEIDIVALDSRKAFAIVSVAPNDNYEISNPGQAEVFVVASRREGEAYAFDRWLGTATNGLSKDDLDRDALALYNRAYAFGLQSMDDLVSNHTSFRIANERPEFRIEGDLNAGDLLWGLQSSNDLRRWNGAASAQNWDAAGLLLTGPELAPEEAGRLYRLMKRRDPREPAADALDGFAGTNVLFTGKASWHWDKASNSLSSTGGVNGERILLVSEIRAPFVIDLAMAIAGGGAEDKLNFYLDGVLLNSTGGPQVELFQEITGSGTHVIMWEFDKGLGDVIISK